MTTTQVSGEGSLCSLLTIHNSAFRQPIFVNSLPLHNFSNNNAALSDLTMVLSREVPGLSASFLTLSSFKVCYDRLEHPS